MKTAIQPLIAVAVLSASFACSGGGGSGGGGPSISFEVSSGVADEGDGLQLVFVVLHTASPLAQPLSVEVADQGNGTAASGDDYEPFAAEVLTFPIGASDGERMFVSIDPINDFLVEAGSETVNLRLQNVQGGSVGAPSTFALTIQNIHAAVVSFPDVGATTLGEVGSEAVAVELDCGSGVSLGIDVRVLIADQRSGSASSGADYADFSDLPVTFPPGSLDGAVGVVDLTLIDDTEIEGSESVELGLTAVSGCTIGAHDGYTLTIADDDLVGPAAFTASEGSDGTGNDLAHDEEVPLGTRTAGTGPNDGTLIRVQNMGGTPMSLDAPELSGAHPDDFAVEIETSSTPLDTFMSGLQVETLPMPLEPLALEGPGLVLAIDPPQLVRARELDHVTWHGLALPGLGTVALELERVRLPLAPDAVLAIDGVAVPGGPRTLIGDLQLWRGAVQGVEGSRAFLALDAERATGFIDLGTGQGGLVHLFPDGPRKVRAVSEPELLALGFPQPDELCRGERFSPRRSPDSGVPIPPDSSALVVSDCRLALETDYQLYREFGSSNALVDYVTGLVGAVSAQYFHDVQTTLSIAYLGVHTSANDGWAAQDAGGDSGDVLNEFQSTWGTHWPVEADLAHFLSGANLGGGMAYRDVLCDTGFGFGVSGNLNGNINWNTWSGSAGGFTWDFVVVAHEIGHNFGARHTHEYCPPLDLCAQNCVGTRNCTRGTIMSYCHTCGGMSNIDLWFHPVSADAMRANANSSCLDASALAPGDFVNYRVRFNPLIVTGALGATLSFRHDALNQPQPFRVQLSGTSN